MNWIVAIDDKVAAASDTLCDILWEWCGIRRATLARGSLIVWAFFALVQNHNVTNLIFVTLGFCLNYNYRSSSLGTLGIIIRILSLASLCVAFFSFFVFLRSAAFAWYLYLTRHQDRPPGRKRRRLSLAKLREMFGFDWMPQPVSVGMSLFIVSQIPARKKQTFEWMARK